MARRLFDRPLTVFIGDVRSGKTSVSVQASKDLAHAGSEVCLVNLDVLHPFLLESWQAPDPGLAGKLTVADLETASPPDAAAVHSRMVGCLKDPCRKMVLDVGADYASLASLAQALDGIPAGSVDLLFVVNFCRPLTRTVEGAEMIARQMEYQSGFRLTGLISNTHLLDDTSTETVSSGAAKAASLARELGIPLVAVCAWAPVAALIRREDIGCPVLGLGKRRSDGGRGPAREKGGKSSRQGAAACRRS